MRRVIFYSWQSDLPDLINREFIQSVLNNVAHEIMHDDTISVEPVIDRDTQGIPGSPEIVSTIFDKIAKADIFVADVTTINGDWNGKKTPNPNVLLELGYALKALGPTHVILVYNTAFGKIEDLPFDLRARKVCSYNLNLSSLPAEREIEMLKLEKILNSTVRAALNTLQDKKAEQSVSDVINAIENNQPNAVVTLRKSLDKLLDRIVANQPELPRDRGAVDVLINHITASKDIVQTFVEISEVISIVDNHSAAIELTKWFGKLFLLYNLPKDFTGQFSNADFEYFRFIGHDLFTAWIGLLLKESRWEIIQTVLDFEIPVKYLRSENGPGTTNWVYASHSTEFLDQESSSRKRISLRADVIKEIHTSPEIEQHISFDEFIEADFFLFLAVELAPEKNEYGLYNWLPWSVLYLKHVPNFIRQAHKVKIAGILSELFRTQNPVFLKERLLERGIYVKRLFNKGWWDYPIGNYEIEAIATK